MSSYYKIVLEYKGTRYLGWQIQPEQMGPTVQGELNKALSVIAKGGPIRSMGAGRTDSGVHAQGQVAKVEIPFKIPPKALVKALNGHLPEDIRVKLAEESDAQFVPTVDAKSKEYHYRFTNNQSSSALQKDFLVNVSFDLDFKLMQEACKTLMGKHDFTNFYTEGSEVNSTIREIFECEIIEVKGEGWMLPSHYIFRIVGDGFLKQMVRLLVGAVWNIGRGKITLNELKVSLSSKKQDKLSAVAPPQGLYMVRVNY